MCRLRVGTSPETRRITSGTQTSVSPDAPLGFFPVKFSYVWAPDVLPQLATFLFPLHVSSRKRVPRAFLVYEITGAGGCVPTLGTVRCRKLRGDSIPSNHLCAVRGLGTPRAWAPHRSHAAPRRVMNRAHRAHVGSRESPQRNPPLGAHQQVCRAATQTLPEAHGAASIRQDRSSYSERRLHTSLTEKESTSEPRSVSCPSAGRAAE